MRDWLRISYPSALIPFSYVAAPGNSTTRRRSGWLVSGSILSGLALLVAYALRELLGAGNEQLPGTDSTNLYVWEVYTRSVLATGRLPHWNPYHFSGTPHLADMQTTVLYTPAVLLRWLPPAAFLAWMAAFHVWLGGAGTVFLSRVLGLHWFSAAAAGLALTLGGSVGAWLYNGHLLLLYCTAWLPWALGLAVLSSRGALLPHPALVLVLVLQFAAGYLQGSLYVTGAVCLYYVYSAVWPEEGMRQRPRWRMLAQLAVVGMLAAGLSAFQLLPVARLVSEAGRTSGMAYETASEGGWTIGDLATFFYPFVGAAAESPHRDVADRLAYVGWVLVSAIPFAFMDRSRRRVVGFFALLAVLAVAVAMSDQLPFYRWHHALFPGLRMPGRVLFLVTLSIAVLGAMGIERFLVLVSLRKWPLLVGGCAVTGLAVAAATMRALPVREAPPAHVWPWLPLLAAGGLVAAAALALHGRMRPALLTVVLFVAIDLTAFAAGAVHGVSVESPESVRRWMGPPDAGRGVSVCENRIGPGEMLVNGQPSVDGMAGMHLGSYADWAYVAKFGDAAPRDGLLRRIGSEGLFPARRDLLDLANVSRIFSCEPLDIPNVTHVSHSGSVYAYRNDAARPRAFWTCDAPEMSRARATDELLHRMYEDGRLVPRHVVNVRWIAGITDEARHAHEERHQLVNGVRLDEHTWRYVLADPSPANGIALVQNVAVEDTGRIDRSTGAVLQNVRAVAQAGDGTRELVVESEPCAAHGKVNVLVSDRPDGRVSLDVDAPLGGLVFLSEPYYAERLAFVDGEQVEPRRANLAFTAVPVPAGRHRVELRHVPRSFHLGLGLTAITLAAWIMVSRKK